MILKLNFIEKKWNDIKFSLPNCLNENLKREMFQLVNVRVNYMPTKRRKRETFYEKLAPNHTSLC